MMQSDRRRRKQLSHLATRCSSCGLLVLGVGLFLACGTIAEGTGGDEHLPRRAIVPFTKLVDGQQPDGLDAPFVLAEEDADLLDPSALLMGDRVVLYLARGTGETADIVRTTSPDGRHFEAGEPVLSPELDWEEGWITAPEVLRHGGVFYLWYVGGRTRTALGLATSSDGRTFTREPAPVLEVAADQRITAASVVRLGGRFTLFYGVATPNGEDDPPPTVIHRADSLDGIDWTARGQVLGGGERCANDRGDEIRCWDQTYVDAPAARVAVTPTGRTLVDLWYTGGITGNSGIGFAASFDGLRFSRFRHNPVLGDGSPERSPTVVDRGAEVLMYYADRVDDRSAIALAVHRRED